MEICAVKAKQGAEDYNGLLILQGPVSFSTGWDSPNSENIKAKGQQSLVVEMVNGKAE